MRFVSLGGYPFVMTRVGRVVGVMPIDALSWTQSPGSALTDSAADARRMSASGQVELRITGTATPLAKRQLQVLGWRTVENAKFRTAGGSCPRIPRLLLKRSRNQRGELPL